jgi:D-serine deaminase-like pyridoxal phosphate-dependent protein
MSHADLGKAIVELDTPSLLLDLNALDRNIATMAAAAHAANADWRPHIKASKAPELAKRLLDGGAVGVTSAKVSEAEQMVDGGVDDILIANEIVGPIKIARLARLARRARLCVAVDDAANLREIAAAVSADGGAIDVLIDINVNMNRCGVPPEAALPLAQLALELDGVSLRGLMGYEGHVMNMEPEEKERATIAAAEQLAEARRLVEAGGIDIRCTSGGGTGNYWLTLQQGHLNELQAGGGVLMDATYSAMGVPNHEYALSILTQVISTPNDERAIGDAGWKTTGHHTGMPLIHGREDLDVVNLSAEHTHYRLAPEAQLRPGEKIQLIPSYSDSTVLLHRQIHAIRNGTVEAVWEVAGAGMLQ